MGPEKISVNKRKNVKRKVDKQAIYEYLAEIASLSCFCHLAVRVRFPDGA